MAVEMAVEVAVRFRSGRFQSGAKRTTLTVATALRTILAVVIVEFAAALLVQSFGECRGRKGIGEAYEGALL
jgi:hypothetical protein